MNPQQVEKLCSHLSPLLLNTIRNKLFKHDTPPTYYDVPEALLFWTADTLATTKLLKPEQLLILLEEFLEPITKFGRTLEIAQLNKDKQLPVCKLGFLDRKCACIDNFEYFLDIETGIRVLSRDMLPLETIVYNLTTLFVNYHKKLKVSSAELGDKNATN
jgi:hypothetical protein